MKKNADLALAAAATVCGTLMMVRWVAAFRGGAYVLTSGMEEESLFAIWKWMHGERVYANPFAPPFAISYFNWLYYWSYGFWVKGIQALMGLDATAIPGIARGLTLLLTLCGTALIYVFLAPLHAVRRIAGTVAIALNPLVGFWTVTVRPDVGALVCDLAALWCVKKAVRSGSVWLLPAWVGFYSAWAFKHSYVAALTAACLYLWVMGKRRDAILFGEARRRHSAPRWFWARPITGTRCCGRSRTWESRFRWRCGTWCGRC